MKNNDNEFVLGVPQAHELAKAFRRNGWNAADVTKLVRGDMARLVKFFLEGGFGFKHNVYLSCDERDSSINEARALFANPLPEKFEFDPSKLRLIPISDCSSSVIDGLQLIEWLKTIENVSFLTLEMREYLMDNPIFVPSDWRNGAKIYFPGTIKSLTGPGGRPYTFEMNSLQKSKADWFFSPECCGRGAPFSPKDYIACLTL